MDLATDHAVGRAVSETHFHRITNGTVPEIWIDLAQHYACRERGLYRTKEWVVHIPKRRTGRARSDDAVPRCSVAHYWERKFGAQFRAVVYEVSRTDSSVAFLTTKYSERECYESECAKGLLIQRQIRPKEIHKS